MADKTIPISSDIPLSTNGFHLAKLHLIRGSDIPDVEQDWLIEDIIPDLTLTGVMAEPGVGKTTFVLGILAYHSRQHPVLMLSSEDNATDIRRTFKRLGGNLDNLFVEDSTTDDLPWLLDNCAALESALKEYKPRIAGIDSFYSHAPFKKNTSRQEEVTPSLLALRRLANKYCPILLIHHDNKSETENPLHKSSGSQGIVATIRHNVRVHLHPTDPDIRVVAVFKTNVGRLNVPSLQFKIYPFEWMRERSDLSAQELLQINVAETKKAQRKKVDIAKEFLTVEMAKGDRLARELKEQAQLWYSISEDTLDRARKLLGINSNPNKDGVWVWSYTRQQ